MEKVCMSILGASGGWFNKITTPSLTKMSTLGHSHPNLFTFDCPVNKNIKS